MGQVIIQDFTTKTPITMIGTEAGVCWGADISDARKNFKRGIEHKKIQYGSSYDGCRVHFQLCCDCFDKAVEQCKVNPIEEVEDE